MRSTRWHKGMKRLLWIGMLLAPQLAHAQTGGQPANPVVMVIVLGVLSLAPFIMVPVGRQMYDQAGVANTKDIFSEASIKSLFDASKKAKEPLRHFLSQHSHVKDRELFMELAVRLERNALVNENRGKQQISAPVHAQPATPAPAAPTQPAAAASTQASVATPAPSTPPPAPTIDE